MKQSTLLMPADLHAYMLAHSAPVDPIQQRIAERTEQFADVAHWRTAPEQSAFLTLLVRLAGARDAIEVGTFTGMSALAIARGLGEGGSLICCDISDQWTPIASEAWRAAGVEDRIDLRIAPALATLRALPSGPSFDFAFVDAEKTGYRDYYEELLGRLRPGGLLVFDNVFRSGRVLDPTNEVDHAVIDFNAALAKDDRVDVVMVPMADGMSLVRKR
ncbi:caffeoyl-CoA O-methyltransferase [Streptacidiphilus sp. MAP12-33]|uniref:O-methyltransferase n=1 Tax=Streptacidiphilus sp. MAP12-33 TaxID=3156266 RepID=UPI003514E6A4